VKLGDTSHLALRNLREAAARTALTSLGVAIGIASLVGMVSFGVALQDQVMGSLLRSGLFDSISVSPASRNPPRGRRAGPAERLREAIASARQSMPRTPLDDQALATIAAIRGVREVYPDVRVPVEVSFGQASEFAVAVGVPMSARGEGVFQDITAGRFFASDADPACLLGLDFARRLTDGRPEELVGKQVTIAYASARGSEEPAAALPGGVVPPGSLPVPPGVNIQRAEREFRVAGLVERQAGPGVVGALFGAVMIPLGKARELGAANIGGPQGILRELGATRTYATATVKVARAQDTEEVEKKIKELGFSAFSISDLLQNQKRAFILLDLVLGLVGSIALTVASLGIVNTMVMSILERTREIGIMKAIGGSDEDIRGVFLVEAMLIGLAGGTFGIVLGWGVGRIINRVANYYLQSQGAPAANLFLIPWWLVAGGVAFGLLVSLLAGIVPARRAARLDPIQALRHD
jgi:putative ABC transport system permease protein